MKPLNEYINERLVSESDAADKQAFAEEWEQMLRTKTPIFEFPDGSYVYINYNAEKGTLETGDMTNSGFSAGADSVSVDIDYTQGLDLNLQGLYDVIIEERPELFDEEEE